MHREKTAVGFCDKSAFLASFQSGFSVYCRAFTKTKIISKSETKSSEKGFTEKKKKYRKILTERKTHLADVEKQQSVLLFCTRFQMYVAILQPNRTRLKLLTNPRTLRNYI